MCSFMFVVFVHLLSVTRTVTQSSAAATSSGSGSHGTTSEAATSTTTTTTKQNFSAIIPPPSFEQFLMQIIILGVIMIYFYLCDYRKVSVRHTCVWNAYWMFLQYRPFRGPSNAVEVCCVCLCVLTVTVERNDLWYWHGGLYSFYLDQVRIGRDHSSKARDENVLFRVKMRVKLREPVLSTWKKSRPELKTINKYH